MKPKEKELSKQFRMIYDLHKDYLWKFCLYRCQQRTEKAQDVMQETFLRFWKYLLKGNEVKYPRALLARIALNMIIDESRKKKQISLDDLIASGGDRYGSEYSIKNTADTIALKEAAAIIKALPESKYKKLLWLNLVCDLEPVEIAKVLNMNNNNVNVSLYYARKMLKKILLCDQ